MAIITEAEKEILRGLNEIIKRNKSPNGLRRTLRYVVAAYDHGEGKIIEKSLRIHFEGMKAAANLFDPVIEESTAKLGVLSDTKGLPTNSVRPFNHLMIGQTSGRAQ